MLSYIDNNGDMRRMIPKACMFGDRTSPRISCTYSVANTHWTAMLFPVFVLLLVYVDDNVVGGVRGIPATIADAEPSHPRMTPRSISSDSSKPLLDSQVAFKTLQKSMDCSGLLCCQHSTYWPIRGDGYKYTRVRRGLRVP